MPPELVSYTTKPARLSKISIEFEELENFIITSVVPTLCIHTYILMGQMKTVEGTSVFCKV